MKLPKVLSPCPIIDAIIEVRFHSNINGNAVFGIVYNLLKDEFSNVQNLPITQIPEPIRLNDPDLKYKPYHRIKNDDYVLQIGPNVVSFSSYPTYVGWENFRKKAVYVLKRVEKAGVVDKVIRLGFRYINFFELDIFNKLKLKIDFEGMNLISKHTVFQTIMSEDNINRKLLIDNAAKYNNKKGSIIDIDISTEEKDKFVDFFKNLNVNLKDVHDIEKQLFFNLLDEDYLKEFNPQY
ncbi:MAG: TIGR04255 family protein [Bacteroidales bacterium]|nr:TIGR04255 family protein [Bacteroidales bacterium]